MKISLLIINLGISLLEIYRLRIQALNDSNSGGANFFDFYRTGVSVDEFRGVKSANTWFVIRNANRRVGIGSSVPTAKLDVDGTVNVTGVSTFASLVDINNDLDVDGHTELDNLNVSGVSTFKNDVQFHNTAGLTTVFFDQSDELFKV